MQWGFTSLVDKSVEKPQCVLCGKVLSAENMKPSKLKCHLERMHSEHVGKDLEFFKRKEQVLKNARIDGTGEYGRLSEATLEASYRIALELRSAKNLTQWRKN